MHVATPYAHRILDTIIELTQGEVVRYCYCEAKVRSSSVSIVYVVRLRIIFSKVALQKRGSMEPIQPPLDPPLLML